jgi:iron complex transport system substrate-binding protein
MPALRRLSCAVLLGVFVSLAWAGEIVLQDDRGASRRFEAPPQRIVSLLPSLTESVCALGGCERLVGTDRFSNWPAQVQALPKLGGLDDVQVERMLALRPQVVLVETSARVIDRLEGLGLTVLVLDTRSHADVRRTLQRLATLLGAPDRADEMWRRVGAELDAARRDVPASLRGKRVYFEVDATPYAAAPGSFIGETLAALGLANVVPQDSGAFPRLNPEFVLRAAPDIVIAPQANLDDMPGRPGWAGLVALRGRRTCAFAPAQFELLVRPGPRLGEAAGLLARCLARLEASPR